MSERARDSKKKKCRWVVDDLMRKRESPERERKGNAHTHTHTRYTERGNNLSTEENVKEEKGEEIRGVKTRKDAQNDIHGAAIVAQEWCQQRRRRKKTE